MTLTSVRSSKDIGVSEPNDTYTLEAVNFGEVLEGSKTCHVQLNGLEVLELLKEYLVFL